MQSLYIVDRQFSELRDGYPWQNFGKGKIVDVGGGSGHVSIYLAKVCTAPFQGSVTEAWPSLIKGTKGRIIPNAG